MTKGMFKMTKKSAAIGLMLLVVIIVPMLGFTVFGREKNFDAEASHGAGKPSIAEISKATDAADVIEMAQRVEPIYEGQSSLHTLNVAGEIDARIISDIHQLAPELRADNDVFEVFLNSGDGKLLKYSTEILEAFSRTLDADILIVSGDLTTNAERATHLWLARYFEAMEAKGTEVFVIPGNHDIDNPHATGFESGKQKRVETITAADFAEIYSAFGYDQAYSRDPASLSYVVRLMQDTYLLMLDTCIYEDNQTSGYPAMEGALRAETLEWLSDINAKMLAQTATKPKIISVSHHNIISHSPVHSEGFVVENSEESVEKLNEMGITLNLSGHIHIQDIEHDPKSDLTEIVSGSLIQYPQTYGVLKLSGDGINYSTEWVDVEGYAMENGLSNPFLLNFKRDAEAHFEAQSRKLLTDRLINAEYDALQVEAMTETFAELNSRYFAGIDSLDKETILHSDGYKLWIASDETFLTDYVKSMLLDMTVDNTLQKGFVE